MTEEQRTKRNLNPTPAARVAMIIWGLEYSKQHGGSMDFWDGLSDERKLRCELVVEALLDGSAESVVFKERAEAIRDAMKFGDALKFIRARVDEALA